MAAFSGNYQTSLKSVGICQPISDFQDQKYPNDVINDLAYQPVEFDTEDALINSVSCTEIMTQDINLVPISSTRFVSSAHDADNALQNLYGSNIESLGWQEIINLIMIEQEQVATALYGASVGDCEVNSLQVDNPVDREDQQTIVDRKQRIVNPSRFRVMDGQFSPDPDHMDAPLGKVHTTHGRMKRRQNDQHVSESVIERYVQDSAQKRHLKKSRRVICKASSCPNGSENYEENSKPRFHIPRDDPAQFLPNIVPEEPKVESQKDYIHLRARNGQATRKHSLAERARRERISKRMKILEDLLPGCDKISGKALVLEQIINYVQSLQKRVEILSMVASLVPICDLNIK